MKARAAGNPLAWLGALLVAYLVIPLVAFATRASGSGELGFGSAGLWNAAKTSLLTATVSTITIAVLGIPLAHWLARKRGLLSAAVNVAVQLPLALPPVMSGILLIYLVGPYTRVGRFFGGRLTDSDAGIVLAQIFVAAPFLVIAARSAFAAIDPAIEELAATLGHRPLSCFLRVSVPIAAPGIRAGLLLTWLRALGEYGATVLLAYHPYSLPVYTYVEFSGSGIPTTQAPTIIAVGLAVLGLVLSRLRLPRSFRAVARPGAQAPSPVRPTVLSFDLDATVGEFRLRLAHRAGSHRLAILGPSGSGKSLTLRCLAGLLGPDVGVVSFGADDVSATQPWARHVGYVAQGAGLLPARTVWQQLMFATTADPGLAAWWLDALQLGGLQDRWPGQLSGGQRQRVSLAQALSHNPRCLLLDEPFSALDTPVRTELRRQLRRLQLQAGLSTVLVTHDPEEAALLADEILVIADGQLLQAGSRDEVYRRPCSAQVARLLGIANFNQAVVLAPGVIAAGGWELQAATADLPAGTAVTWSVREEDVVLSGTGRQLATVTDVADLGGSASVTVLLGGSTKLSARTPAGTELKVVTAAGST